METFNPQFQGFFSVSRKLIRKWGELTKDFQSPVLGVFLCFITRIAKTVFFSASFNPQFQGFFSVSVRGTLCLRWLPPPFQSPVLGVFLCFSGFADQAFRRRFINFQSPVLGVFLCFIFGTLRKEIRIRCLSIPSFRGFSLFPFNLEHLKDKIAIYFQSPVLGVFLCFLKVRWLTSDGEVAFNPQFQGFFSVSGSCLQQRRILKSSFNPQFQGFFSVSHTTAS